MVVVERRFSYSISKLLLSSLWCIRLMPLIPSNVIAGVAGITADANSLINYARQAAQSHLFSLNEDIPVEQLTQRLCDLKQGYTQYGGMYHTAQLIDHSHNA